MKGGFMIAARWSCLRELTPMRDTLRRLVKAIRGMGEVNEGTWRSGSWSPAVDLYEIADALILKAELPGFSKADVTIEIKQHALLLKGTRPRDSEVAQENYHCMERPSGSFQRWFLLPAPIDSEKVTVSCQDGLLKLRLPKATAARPSGPPSVHGARVNGRIRRP
jgi:HSP20 family protein